MRHVNKGFKHLTYPEARQLEQLIQDVWQKDRGYRGESTDTTVAHVATQKLGRSVSGNQVAKLRKVLGWTTSRPPTLPKAVLTRIALELQAHSRVVLVRTSRNKVQVFSYEGFRALSNGMKERKTWLQRGHNVAPAPAAAPTTT